MNTDKVWMVVADTNHARLLRGGLTDHDRVHLDEIADLKTTFTAGEHHRPSLLKGVGRAATPGHEKDERIAHFARQLSQWLEHELPARGIAACRLFAPSHLLGALRKQLPKTLAPRIHDHEGELANLSTAQLVAHPAVAGGLRAPPAGAP